MKKKIFDENAIAIGNFDGFHLGHQQIVSTLIKISNEQGLISTVLTFTPHPKLFFKKEKFLILSDREKKDLIKGMQVKQIFFLNFEDIYQLKASVFIKEVLLSQYHMKHLIIGENFQLGKNRETGVEEIKKQAQENDFDVTIVPSLIQNGIHVSSSYIRKKLGEGDIKSANKMLGRVYTIEGIVVKGNKIGREIGFPTINIESTGLILPNGVFKTRVKVGDHIYHSITNIGQRPTFSGEELRIESHILGFNKRIYGQKVTILFEDKIRDEIKFDTESELIRQINKDIKELKVDKKPLF
jgi:riboflavin kinase/FMN adenylyltransferase